MEKKTLEHRAAPYIRTYKTLFNAAPCCLPALANPHVTSQRKRHYDTGTHTTLYHAKTQSTYAHPPAQTFLRTPSLQPFDLHQQPSGKTQPEGILQRQANHGMPAILRVATPTTPGERNAKVVDMRLHGETATAATTEEGWPTSHAIPRALQQAATGWGKPSHRRLFNAGISLKERRHRQRSACRRPGPGPARRMHNHAFIV